MRHRIKHYTLVLTTEEMNIVLEALVEASTIRPGYKDLQALTDAFLSLRPSGSKLFSKEGLRIDTDVV